MGRPWRRSRQYLRATVARLRRYHSFKFPVCSQTARSQSISSKPAKLAPHRKRATHPRRLRSRLPGMRRPASSPPSSSKPQEPAIAGSFSHSDNAARASSTYSGPVRLHADSPHSTSHTLDAHAPRALTKRECRIAADVTPLGRKRMRFRRRPVRRYTFAGKSPGSRRLPMVARRLKPVETRSSRFPGDIRRNSLCRRYSET